MKPVKNYILLVDNYRRSSRQRNTAGRYRVGAKSPEEAVQLLREKIKFGSIQVYYCADDPAYQTPGSLETTRPRVGYKEVVKEEVEFNMDTKTRNYKQIQPRSATSPMVEKEEKELD